MPEEIARGLGFDDAAEMFSLIAGIDLSTPARMEAFKAWQTNDGTKLGLLQLYQRFGVKSDSA